VDLWPRIRDLISSSRIEIGFLTTLLGELRVRHAANSIEEMKRVLLGYRDNMRVEIEIDVPLSAKTVADLRALPTWPDRLVLDIHVDLDPRLSVVRVERAS
jgi:divalent metal cation (Fe/Co/Zn/Cd) transporter